MELFPRRLDAGVTEFVWRLGFHSDYLAVPRVSSFLRDYSRL